MLAEKKTKTNIGVGIGIALQFAGRMFLGGNKEDDPVADEGLAFLGLILVIAGLLFFIWGCMNYAEGKGHSRWVGLIGILSCIGLIILVILPDHYKEAKPPPHRERNARHGPV